MGLLWILAWSLMQWPGSQAAEGNALYRQKQYTQALEAYRAAQAKDPQSPALHYNIGNTLYRQEKYGEAIEAYTRAVNAEKPLNARAYYNLGNSLYRTGRLQEAAEAYKQALRITPDDMDAKYNLEFVLRQLQEQTPQGGSSQEPPQDEPEKPSEPSDASEGQDPEAAPEETPQTQAAPEETPRTPEQPLQPGEMSREEAERLLNALNQEERDLQKRLRHHGPSAPPRPRKPW